jgi:predicted GNAT superfamily acetyltransferase
MPDSTQSTITIRDLVLAEEVYQVEELQKEVWGMNDRDVTPLTHLVAAREAGGVLIGAFDGAVLAGFAYGFVGYEQGELTLHSHMLAVKPAYRNRNLGYRLKLAQRDQALERGIERMTWTFDPLQSLNAHFNFSKLGVVSDQYKINFYGESTSSFLHRTGTDRLWVSWLLDSRRVKDRIEGMLKSEALEFDKYWPLIRVGKDWLPHINNVDEPLAQMQAVLEIPGSIDTLQQTQPELAVTWREATRLAFSRSLAAGFIVEEFYRSSREGQQFGAYLLKNRRDLRDFSGFCESD